MLVGTLNVKQTTDLHLILLDSNFTNIEQQKVFSKSISVFPNPVYGQMYVTGMDPAIRFVNLFISDETGKIIISTTYNKNTAVNTTFLKPGIYFLRVITDHGEDYKTSFVVR